jgi:hypothetical protein
LLVVVAVVAVGALAACGSGASSANGAIACDTSAQNCPAGMTCDLICRGGTTVMGCRAVAATPTAIGAGCDGMVEDTCAHGSGCYASPETSQFTCVVFCATDADCPGARCQERTTTRGCGTSLPPVFNIKFCLP